MPRVHDDYSEGQHPSVGGVSRLCDCLTLAFCRLVWRCAMKETVLLVFAVSSHVGQEGWKPERYCVDSQTVAVGSCYLVHPSRRTADDLKAFPLVSRYFGALAFAGPSARKARQNNCDRCIIRESQSESLRDMHRGRAKIARQGF
jgi:hypothetical protein